jgi:leader peptidase (prepilin peptidase) / N-methyltransferase
VSGVGTVDDVVLALQVLLDAAAFGVAGGAAGVFARLVLARLGRGAVLRPGWCEAGVALLWAAAGAGWAAGVLPGDWVPVLMGAGWLGVAAGAVDVARHRLPDALTLPALPAALVLLTPLGGEAVLRGAAGAAVAAAVHGGVHLLVPRAMGAGDVKLAAPLGAVLAAAAWPAVVLAAVLAALATAVVGLGGWVTGRWPLGGALPHGPSMLVATWVVLAGAALGAGGG